MLHSTGTIRDDFDRLALLSDEGWGHNGHYHDYLLNHIPAHCASALDIGCGTGAFSRLLARRADHVLAIDLSPNMIRVAQERSEGFSNIEYRVADALTYGLPAGAFDCAASIATLHHLPLEAMLSRMRETLRSGGVLAALDLFRAESLADLLTSALAIPVNAALRLVKQGRLRQPRAVRDAWAVHGQHDSYLTLSAVRRVCAEVLPGASVRRHLLWRYSLIWRK